MRMVLLSALAPLALVVGGCSTPPPSAAGQTATVTAPPRPAADASRREHARAVELIREKKYADAERVLTGLLSSDAGDGPAHNSLGTVYYRQSKFYLAAWEFQYAAKVMPYRPEPRNNLGLLYEDLGKLDDAIGWYQRAVALEPENPNLIGNLARARVRRGDRDEDLRALLASLVSRDARPEWVDWARERLALTKWPATTAPTSRPAEGE